MQDYDWQAAERLFRVAMAQPTVTPEIRHLYGYFHLRVVGRAAEAVVAHRRAMDEDPLNLIIRVGHAVSLLAAGRDAEAAEEARRILEMDPNFTAAYSLQALDVTAVPPAEALAYAEKGLEIAPWTKFNVGLLAAALETGSGATCSRPDGGARPGPVRHPGRVHDVPRAAQRA